MIKIRKDNKQTIVMDFSILFLIFSIKYLMPFLKKNKIKKGKLKNPNKLCEEKLPVAVQNT